MDPFSQLALWFTQDVYPKFYQAFLYADRWKLYLEDVYKRQGYGRIWSRRNEY